jgi:hypothetical protein
MRAALPGNAIPQPAGDLQRPARVLGRGVVRVGSQGLLRGAPPVLERPLPVLGEREVMGQRLGVLREAVDVDLLDGPDGR